VGPLHPPRALQGHQVPPDRHRRDSELFLKRRHPHASIRLDEMHYALSRLIRQQRVNVW
jgi:hypothetical protein